jgi:hypothetical protein
LFYLGQHEGEGCGIGGIDSSVSELPVVVDGVVHDGPGGGWIGGGVYGGSGRVFEGISVLSFYDGGFSVGG